jgi:hypothetical protein
MSTQTIQPELIPADDRNWKKPDALAPVTPLSLMEIALRNNQVEQLQILQAMHFRQLDRDAEIEFNEAMNAVQNELGRIAPNLTNPQTRSKYASYDKLDRELRPVYTRNGFSLSFSEEDSPKPDHIRIICYVSHKGGHTRMYRKDMPVVTTGIKGNEMMTPTHATCAADSYAKRYLVKDIFNIAIGEDDTDGNAPAQRRPEFQKEYEERCKHFDKCHSQDELKEHWMASRAWAREIKDETAVNDFDYLKEKRKKELAK